MLLLLASTVQKDNVTCQLCLDGMNVVYDLIGHGAGHDAIISGLDNICKMFSDETAVQQCETFINEEYDKLVAWLEADYPAETLCTLMTACDYPYEPINSACDACMVGFTFLEDMWSYGPSVDLMEMALDYVCYIFPEGEWRNECETFINKEFDNLIGWIDSTFPPEYICTMLGACDFPVNPVDDGLCVFCEGAFQFLYDMFDFDTDSQQLVESALKYICHVFGEGSEARAQCQAFVNQEYEWLVSYLTLEFPPESVCILAGACESPVVPEYETECEFCTIFYQFAYDLLDFEPTVDAVEALLDHVCDVFGDKDHGFCNSFINKHFEKLVDSLLQKYPTDVACNLMGACLE